MRIEGNMKHLFIRELFDAIRCNGVKI